jgi:hypothetical protein
MAISSQELSELKSRVLVAIRTRSNIARVSDYLIRLIREAGSYLPERPKTDTDTEYLYSVILAVEEKQGSVQASVTEEPEPAPVKEKAPVIPEPVELEEAPVIPEPVEESAPEITTVEELDSAEVESIDNQEAEESVPEHPEVQKPKGGKQSKKSKK